MNLIERVARRLRRELSLFRGFDPTTGARIDKRGDLSVMGNRGASWTVPTSTLTERSVVYCFGCGEDISFDLELIERFGCHVHAFDPTPRAIAHVTGRTVGNPKYHFQPLGIWDEDTTLRFYAPRDPRHVSHSALNLQSTTEYFDAPVRRLRGIMQSLGHERLDLLKLDIEGAEYRVLRTLVEDRILPLVLCVEFDEYFNPLDDDYRERVGASVSSLLESGYKLVHSSGRANYAFVARAWQP